MHLTILRGSQEIGGSCVELHSESTRIIIDIGLPIKDKDGLSFDFKKYQGYTVDELVSKGILPDVCGLYTHQTPEIAAVFISHPHQDHYGLMQYIHPDIPVYLSEGTKILIERTGRFNGTAYLNNNIRIIKPGVLAPEIGPFSIQSYLVDHSGFDSIAFLIEADNKRIFYSGDFRTHGRKGWVMEKIIANPPKDIDYLILEGTLMGNDRKSFQKEENIEAKLVDVFKSTSKFKIISFSSQNIDRLISVFKACVISHHTLVIDPYTANILDKLKPTWPGLPQFNWNNIRIYFTPNAHSKKLDEDNELKKYSQAKITLNEIKQQSAQIVMKNNYMNSMIFAKYGLLKNAELIYSQWKGYYEKEKPFWEKHHVYTEFIHTSGHAFAQDLKRFADALQPANIIPIHTEHSKKYSPFFSQNVLTIKDGDIYKL